MASPQQMHLREHLRAVADKFRPLLEICVTEQLRSELQRNKVLIVSTLLAVKRENM